MIRIIQNHHDDQRKLLPSESQDTSQLDLHPPVPPVLANHTTNGDPQVMIIIMITIIVMIKRFF